MNTNVDDNDHELRTHDDAQRLLRYAAQGARVTFAPINERDVAAARSRQYVVTMERFGESPLSMPGVYTLPARADRLRKHMHSLLERAAGK